MPRLFFTFLFACSLFAIHCSPVFSQEIGQQMEGFNLEGYNETGQKAWDVKGTTADIKADTVEIKDVDANHYGEDQKVNLKAETGTINKVTGNIELKKDVVITSENGSQMKTDTLNWEKDKDLVSTKDPVVITDKNMEATGSGMTAHPQQQIAELQKDVNVKVNVEPEKTPGKLVNITCDGPMEIDQRQNIATFNKNVVAVQEDKTLKADKVEVYFDPDKKKIEQLVCLGNVVITQGENVTYAEKAVYTAQDQRMVLSGQPKLIFLTEGGGLAGFGSKDE